MSRPKYLALTETADPSSTPQPPHNPRLYSIPDYHTFARTHSSSTSGTLRQLPVTLRRKQSKFANLPCSKPKCLALTERAHPSSRPPPIHDNQVYSLSDYLTSANTHLPLTTFPRSRFMLCGKHPRPANVPIQSRYTRHSRRVEQHEYYSRELAEGERRGSCICDYSGFPVLLRERGIIAHQPLERFEEVYRCPSSWQPQEQLDRSFLRLPAELRSQIFEYCLVLNEAIEFCPHVTAQPQKLDSRNQEAFDHSDQFFASKVEPYARLMRVSKQIHAETAPIFYGQNEFRFSNATGWIVLNHFLHQIGPDKSSMLRNITVLHPGLMEMPVSHYDDTDRSICALRFRWEDIVNQCEGSLEHARCRSREPKSLGGYGLARDWHDVPISFDGPGSRKRRLHKPTSLDAARILNKASKLKHLQLIVAGPGDERNIVPALPSDETVYGDLTVELLALRPVGSLMGVGHAGNDARHKMKEQGAPWQWEEKEADYLGCY